jgi:hypothetical protein
MNDVVQALGVFIGLMGVAVALSALVLLIVWAGNDARARGKSALLVTIACVIFFPWGLIAWLLFRPPRTGTPNFPIRTHAR